MVNDRSRTVHASWLIDFAVTLNRNYLLTLSGPSMCNETCEMFAISSPMPVSAFHRLVPGVVCIKSGRFSEVWGLGVVCSAAFMFKPHYSDGQESVVLFTYLQCVWSDESEECEGEVNCQADVEILTRKWHIQKTFCQSICKHVFWSNT